MPYNKIPVNVSSKYNINLSVSGISTIPGILILRPDLKKVNGI